MTTPRWRALVLLLALPVLAGCATILGRAERTAAVTGKGTVVVPPDTVVVVLGVQTRGSEVGPAVAENNRAAEKVIKSVTDLGVAPEDVQTTFFNISIMPRYDEFGNPTKEVTYQVDNTITVSLHDIAALGNLLGNALASGANSVQGLTYTVSDPAAVLEPARKEALADAQRQAEQLASSSGMTLGPILTISESSSAATPGLRAYAGAEAAAGTGVPTAPGSLEFDVQMSITYQLR